MKRFILFVYLSVAFASCSPMDFSQMEPIEYKVTKWEAADFSSLKRFGTEIADYGDLLFFLDKNLTFRVAAISYPTVDPNEDPVWASGLVYHPVNQKSKGVIDFMPMARLRSDRGTSEDLFVTEGLLALVGYTLIIPDLIGSGASKDKMVPFLMAENTGRVSYDMHRAAAQYLWDEFRYALPSETVILGYSLGGSAALATQKYYETHHSNTVKIKEVRSGGGPYDLVAAFLAYAQSEISEFPAIPHTINAFNHYYKLELDFSQIYTGILLEDDNYKTWFHGQYGVEQLQELLGTDLHAYMHPDFFLPFDQQNDEFKKLHPLLIENSVTEGWCPKAPIYLSCARDDAFVPAACAESALKKLRKAGANISLQLYSGGHVTVGFLFYLQSVIRYLL